MIRTRAQVIREQLALIVEPFDSPAICEALSHISFAVLPDWGEFEIELWMIDGLKPIFATLFSLAEDLQTELLECISLFYSSRHGARPDFDLSELKRRLEELSVLALPYAISIIAQEGGEGVERYLRRYSDHKHQDVRSEALAALSSLTGL